MLFHWLWMASLGGRYFFHFGDESGPERLRNLAKVTWPISELVTHSSGKGNVSPTLQ